MAHDTVWIIVPVYNAEKTLKKCVRSIQKQTYKNWRLVLVDDGSKDKSGEMCDKFAEKDDRIVVIHQPNAGPSVARKTGIAFAENGYCCFLDSDDSLPYDSLGFLIAEIEKTQADLVCGQMQRIYKGIKFPSRFLPPCFKSPKEHTKDEILSELYISCFGISDFPTSLCAKVYRTQALREVVLSGCETPEKFAEDLDVIMRILPLCDRISITDKIVYNYRIGGGTSRFMPEILTDSVFMYNRKKEYMHYYTGELDAHRLIAIELKNIAMSYWAMCNRFNKFPLGGDLKKEIEIVCDLPEIKEVATLIEGDTSGFAGSAEALISMDAQRIAAVVCAQQENDKGIKAIAKKIMARL